MLNIKYMKKRVKEMLYDYIKNKDIENFKNYYLKNSIDLSQNDNYLLKNAIVEESYEIAEFIISNNNKLHINKNSVLSDSLNIFNITRSKKLFDIIKLLIKNEKVKKYYKKDLNNNELIIYEDFKKIDNYIKVSKF
tara:strand:+ start:12260 stop:12667 length:408 start_codon:yes stop_codon:yes gene_type:complete